MNKDGVEGEQIFKDFCESNNIKYLHCKHPFDFLINNEFYVEVKSAKLFIKNCNNKNIYTQGRYECWSKKQIDKLKKEKCYVCFIIRHKKNYIIQGFIKSNNYPNKKKISPNIIESLRLIGEEHFIKIANGKYRKT